MGYQVEPDPKDPQDTEDLQVRLEGLVHKECVDSKASQVSVYNEYISLPVVHAADCRNIG